VILSTHEVKEAEALFDRAVILRDGDVLLDERAETLRARGTSVVEAYRNNMQ
jgi:ABC-2 type transport system ATP-binding protein